MASSDEIEGLTKLVKGDPAPWQAVTVQSVGGYLNIKTDDLDPTQLANWLGGRFEPVGLAAAQEAAIKRAGKRMSEDTKRDLQR